MSALLAAARGYALGALVVFLLLIVDACYLAWLAGLDLSLCLAISAQVRASLFLYVDAEALRPGDVVQRMVGRAFIFPIMAGMLWAASWIMGVL